MNKPSPILKRILAYVIDMAIFGIIIWIAGMFLKNNQNISVLNLELNEINELAFNHEIGIMTYLSRYAEIMFNLDQQKVLLSIVNCFFILLYFVGMPYFFDGMTLGKKLMGIKVVRRDGELLMLNDLIIRNLIINGLGFMLISLCILYITPSMVYFIISTILGIFQIILVIISVFMIIYRKDKRGLHDILGNTKVISVK